MRKYSYLIFLLLGIQCTPKSIISNTNTVNASTDTTLVILKDNTTNKDSLFLDSLLGNSYNKINFSSAKFEKYILRNDEGFFVDTTKLKATSSKLVDLLNVNDENHKDNVDWLYNVSPNQYYTIFIKRESTFLLVDSFIEYSGDNDIPGVFFQLNTMDKYGNYIDRLIVFDRFNFEILLKKEYTTDESFSKIKIQSIEEHWLVLNEKNDIVGTKEKPLIIKSEEIYELDSIGKFKLSKNEN
ncbi:hypothetical protein [Bernardetia sp. MNP-M8]|uniref:hypothetical protein n=1 Tax=Bernardetia sp. MNP-M8 TaxID=3127470 RepID=UPI0030D175D2